MIAMDRHFQMLMNAAMILMITVMVLWMEATATDAPLWYADADADGFGSVLNVVPSCTQPIIESSDGSSVIYVSDNTDCNDSDAWFARWSRSL